MFATAERLAHSKLVNVIVGVLFAIFALVGYKVSGQTFLTEWAGGVAAAIGIACLIFKTQGYWVWSIVNAVLWFFLFLDFQLPMLAGLQVMYVVFSLYGLTVWATTHNRIGYSIEKWKDNLGTLLGFAILAYVVYAFRDMEAYTFTGWWYVEFFGTFISICAFWMDAFKYRTNWILWSATNVLFFPLFIHNGLTGPAVLTVLFQTLCIFGIIKWYRDQKEAVETGEVELVGGAQYA
jgi:nicotinamide mononucleotide transporter